ncbi:gamma-secretase subunit pen-2, partial [Aphelenchoides avenae]
MVALERLNGAEKLDICRKYFFMGLALMPLAWIVNVCWFCKYAYGSEEFEQKRSIRFYVNLSLVGALVGAAIFTGWIVFFQCERARGMVWTDYFTM